MQPSFEAEDTTGWMDLIASHILRYPAMTARDVYKLLYQGILGPEHSMPSAEYLRVACKPS